MTACFLIDLVGVLAMVLSMRDTRVRVFVYRMLGGLYDGLAISSILPSRSSLFTVQPCSHLHNLPVSNMQISHTSPTHPNIHSPISCHISSFCTSKTCIIFDLRMTRFHCDVVPPIPSNPLEFRFLVALTI